MVQYRVLEKLFLGPGDLLDNSSNFVCSTTVSISLSLAQAAKCCSLVQRGSVSSCHFVPSALLFLLVSKWLCWFLSALVSCVSASEDPSTVRLLQTLIQLTAFLQVGNTGVRLIVYSSVIIQVRVVYRKTVVGEKEWGFTRKFKEVEGGNRYFNAVKCNLTKLTTKSGTVR